MQRTKQVGEFAVALHDHEKADLVRSPMAVPAAVALSVVFVDGKDWSMPAAVVVRECWQPPERTTLPAGHDALHP